MNPEPTNTQHHPPQADIDWQNNPKCDPRILAVVPREPLQPGKTGDILSKIPKLLIRGAPCFWDGVGFLQNAQAQASPPETK